MTTRSPFDFYPWQHRLQTQLSTAWRAGRLSHALIISGVEGMGKHDFSRAFSAILCCDSAGDIACQRCKSCHLFSAGTHPDLIEIIPAEAGHSIKIDQIRRLNEKVNQRPHYRAKVVIIDPVHAMTRGAANALLKNLEEPLKNTFYFLLTDNIQAIPATIRSRCQQWSISDPQALPNIINYFTANSADEIAIALALCDDSPLLAEKLLAVFPERLRFIDAVIGIIQGSICPITVGQSLIKTPNPFQWNWLCACIEDILKLASGASDNFIINKDKIAELRICAAKILIDNFVSLLHLCYEIKKSIYQGMNLNEQLEYENILCRLNA